jgi:hypothetical protein
VPVGRARRELEMVTEDNINAEAFPPYMPTRRQHDFAVKILGIKLSHMHAEGRQAAHKKSSQEGILRTQDLER